MEPPVTYAAAARAGVDVEMPDIETFEYQYPGGSAKFAITTDEFTSICPKTGHPDYATVTIEYEPNKLCLELKSLKYYLQAYRNVGVFYEHGTVKILRDLVAACAPLRMTVTAQFSTRGGLRSRAVAEHWADLEDSKETHGKTDQAS